MASIDKEIKELLQIRAYCRNKRIHGVCKRGDRCQYSHDLIDAIGTMLLLLQWESPQNGKDQYKKRKLQRNTLEIRFVKSNTFDKLTKCILWYEDEQVGSLITCSNDDYMAICKRLDHKVIGWMKLVADKTYAHQFTFSVASIDSNILQHSQCEPVYPLTQEQYEAIGMKRMYSAIRRHIERVDGYVD
jgi:hypothetical protein